MPTSTKHNLKWHKENCPCEGRPQEPSKNLRMRQKDIPSSGHYQTGVKTSFFRKPGSQNRKK